MDHHDRKRDSPRTPRRSNADYRWTVPKVAAFLGALARSGRVADAARAVGMSRQAAYRLRARLDGPQFRAAFDSARRQGLAARATAHAVAQARAGSRWEGPGLGALDHLRAGGAAAVSQGDAPRSQGYAAARPQGDT